jgi:hypothetical protein
MRSTCGTSSVSGKIEHVRLRQLPEIGGRQIRWRRGGVEHTCRHRHRGERGFGPEIGRGKEHIVYHEPGSDWVIKVPRALPLWMLNKLFGGPSRVVKEVADMLRRLTESDGKVRVPTTIVLFTRQGYKIQQAYIQEDHSVRDVATYLREAGQPFLAARATVSGDNFLTCKGVVWAIDPTFNPYYRLLVAAGMLNDEKYIRMVSLRHRLRSHRLTWRS